MQAIQQTQANSTMSFADVVRRAFHQMVLSGTSSAENVALLFGMHERTLRKRLTAERTSLHELVSQTRFELAKQLLKIRDFHCRKSLQRCAMRTRRCFHGRSAAGRRRAPGNGAPDVTARPLLAPMNLEKGRSNDRFEASTSKAARGRLRKAAVDPLPPVAPCRSRPSRTSLNGWQQPITECRRFVSETPNLGAVGLLAV
jgi:AraC-like DNA-binding protein